MATIKKAQTGFKAVADKTKVKKRVPASIPSGSPAYKYLYPTVRSFGGPRTAKDTAEYKKGYKQGLTGKAEKWTSAADYNRTRSSGWQEGYETRERMKKSKKQRNGGKTPAWQRKEGKNPSGGLNAKGVASYRAANPGSKLKTAVTTKPSKLKAGSKAANRRKSFCARMSGMKKRLTSAKTANDPNSRINKSLRKWNC